MNLLDSSGWLEYFTNGKNAEVFAPVVRDVETVIVPTICMYEVFKVILRETNQSLALQAIAAMEEGEVVDLNQEIAISAAKFSHHKQLPMADSIIYTIAQKRDATLWTQDADFKGLADVKYIERI